MLGRSWCPCRREAGIEGAVEATRSLCPQGHDPGTPGPVVSASSSPQPGRAGSWGRRTAGRGAPAEAPSPAGRVGRVTNDASRPQDQDPTRILVYSDDATVRSQVTLALGRRPHPDLPPAEYVEVATEPVVLQQMDSGTIDLAILDGEAVPVGGMGIAKQMKDEIY